MPRINAYKKRINFFLSLLRMMDEQISGRAFLFVGCGSGLEALCLKQEVQDAMIIGVDIDRNAFVDQAKNGVSLVVCDCSSLPFIGEVFDFCYCSHVLEHVFDYKKCLDEIKRILKINGGTLLSTPNRRRLIGYMGSAQETSLYEVIRWNFSELLARFKGDFLPGKFHCGFYEEELRTALNRSFSLVVPVTAEYNIHASRGSALEPFVKLFHIIRILRIFTVSHVFYCRRSCLLNRLIKN